MALWIAQIALATVFAGSGLAKSLMSKDRMLATGQSGVRDLPLGLIRFVAICELLAAAGLILPVALGIAPILTAVAALGLAILMIGAAVLHARLGEPKAVVVNATLFALAVYVACGRAG